MFINLDPSSTTPMFQQIHDRIIEGIARGEISHGDKLDPVRRVAAEFGINPATVQKAYDLLRTDGVVVTEKRSGSTINIAARPTASRREQLRQDLNRVASRAAIQGFRAEEIHAELANILNSITANAATSITANTATTTESATSTATTTAANTTVNTTAATNTTTAAATTNPKQGRK